MNIVALFNNRGAAAPLIPTFYFRVSVFYPPYPRTVDRNS